VSAAASVRDLRIAFDKRTLFDRVSLSLEPGTFTAIVGPNGSGKSTLLRVFAGAKKPQAGTVAIPAGIAFIASTSSPPPDVTPLELADYGLALRRPWWRFAPGAEDADASKRAIDRVGLADRARDPVSTLSDGEVQRAWIAAALAIGGSTLLIDEPTSHLDLRYQLEVLQTLKRLTSTGVAVAAAVHDLTLAARFADVIALLSGGALVSGRPRDVITRDAVARAFGIDVTVFTHPTEGYLVCLPS